jgi:invasion protein IalB
MEMRTGNTFLATIGALLSFVTPAWAQAPQRTTATFEDWTVVCVRPGDKEKSCEVVHSQVMSGQLEPVGQVTITRASTREPYKLILQVPPNISFATGVRFVFDEKEQALVPTFRWCINTRCRADADISEQALKIMRARTEPGRVEFKEASERDVATPVSFKGFKLALEYMEKQ